MSSVRNLCLLLACLLVMLAPAHVFSQAAENQDSVELLDVWVPPEEQPQKNQSSDFSFERLSLAVFGLFQLPLYGGADGYADVVSKSVGAGLSLELGLPFAAPIQNQFGLLFRAFWRYDFTEEIDEGEVITSLNDVAATFGFFYKIPLGTQNVLLVPELGYGAMLHIVDAPEAANLDSLYVSHLVHAATALRVNVSGAADFVMLDASPMYTLLIEKDGEMMHELGARLGLSFKLVR